MGWPVQAGIPEGLHGGEGLESASERKGQAHLAGAPVAEALVLSPLPYEEGLHNQGGGCGAEAGFLTRDSPLHPVPSAVLPLP